VAAALGGDAGESRTRPVAEIWAAALPLAGGAVGAREPSRTVIARVVFCEERDARSFRREV
jgi:hypothetical protein